MNNTGFVRSVDSLQKIYAVIISLAIGQTINEVIKTENNFLSTDFLNNSLPALLSFFAFLIPFYHGMNRHLDLCYIEKAKDKNRGALLFDFIIFCLESSLLFIFSKYITKGLECFIIIGGMLMVDMVWSFVSHFIHYNGKFSPSVMRWSIINFVTLFIGFLIYSINIFDFKAYLFLFIAIARAIADYWTCWTFYFPKEEE